MAEEKALTTNLVDYAIDIKQVGKQTALIQELLTNIMKGPSDEHPEGLHYGLIPGCGPKPVLLQAGAQKICQTFQIHCNTVERHQLDLPGNHREVRFRVQIVTNANGMVIGEGVATCTTMEKKYRYRRGSDLIVTDKEVPKAFWDLPRDERNGPAGKALLGGPDRAIKKDESSGKKKWIICIKGGQPIEHDNPADYWNTIEKIAYKRAHMHAVINATACSDIFEQDLEVLKEIMEADDIIEVSAQPYQMEPKEQKSVQTTAKAETPKEPEKPQNEPKDEPKPEKAEVPDETEKDDPGAKPEAEEKKKKPAKEKQEAKKSSNIKGPTSKPVSAAPKKPVGEEHSTQAYAEFIAECFQANIERTISLDMLEVCCGKSVDEGWTTATINLLMGVYSELAKDPKKISEKLQKYFPGHYD